MCATALDPERLAPCRYCGARPEIRRYGAGRADIYCPSPDSRCWPPCFVSGAAGPGLAQKWNATYGARLAAAAG
jgi:hypothetical protein